MNVCPYPIAVMSFKRPDLLSEVLKSLKNQSISLDESRIYLFQDGAPSRFTQAPVDEPLQEECVKRFREAFPNGQVAQSPVNLGVALNFDRAERLFFDKLGAECGLFFEDDLALSPYYLDTLLQLTDFALAEPLVGYVAAYGDHTAGLELQRSNAKKIIAMKHNWGFGITRRQWLQQKDIVEGYLSILREQDYMQRDHARIAEYFESFGFVWDGSSQDCAKAVAGLVLGTTRIMCFPCFGHYIGREGLHFRPHIYDNEGYGKSLLFDQPIRQFDLPSRTELLGWIDEERKLRSSRIIELSVQTDAVKYIQELYQLLLGRPADDEGLINWLRAIRSGYSLSSMVKAFVDSAEFKEKFSAS